jgi:AcrR family transcriptional regulator
MTDVRTLEDRLVAAALRLAAERPWGSVGLVDIAEAAGVTLADLRTVAAGKGDILACYTRSIDAAVLEKARARPAGQSARDTLFEVVMSRFDAMQPHKAALRSIAADQGPDLAMIRGVLASQHWMLAAAGIDSGGIGGGLRLSGLAQVYWTVFRIWLEDDDPGLARTMAGLDRRLRSGERTLGMIEDVVAGAGRLVGALIPGFGRRPPPEKPAAPKDGAAAT